MSDKLQKLLDSPIGGSVLNWLKTLARETSNDKLLDTAVELQLQRWGRRTSKYGDRPSKKLLELLANDELPFATQMIHVPRQIGASTYLDVAEGTLNRQTSHASGLQLGWGTGTGLKDGLPWEPGLQSLRKRDMRRHLPYLLAYDNSKTPGWYFKMGPKFYKGADKGSVIATSHTREIPFIDLDTATGHHIDPGRQVKWANAGDAILNAEEVAKAQGVLLQLYATPGGVRAADLSSRITPLDFMEQGLFDAYGADEIFAEMTQPGRRWSNLGKWAYKMGMGHPVRQPFVTGQYPARLTPKTRPGSASPAYPSMGDYDFTATPLFRVGNPKGLVQNQTQIRMNHDEPMDALSENLFEIDPVDRWEAAREHVGKNVEPFLPDRLASILRNDYALGFTGASVLSYLTAETIASYAGNGGVV